MDAQIGERLRSLRGGVTQEQLATSVNLKLSMWGSRERWQQSTLTRIETGERPLRLREAVAVCEALGVALDELVPGYSSAIHNRTITELSRVARKLGDLHGEIVTRVETLNSAARVDKAGKD